MKISVVLATFNEDRNLTDCFKSVKDISCEIIVVDGGSTDKTVEIAKSFGAKVVETTNPPIFHINKQKAMDLATSEWILQLDADERVTPKLADEITKVIQMSENDLDEYQLKLPHRELFLTHQRLLAERDGVIGVEEGPYNAFFIPRANYFLGKYLRFGGVYPDGVIRLVKKGTAHFPCKSVHEQIEVEGRVGWLKNDLIHMADPTFKRYLQRNSRYIDLIAEDLKQNKVKKNIFELLNYLIVKPGWWFLMTLFLHRGILDGAQGFVFSLFSSLRFPRAYIRYLLNS